MSSKKNGYNELTLDESCEQSYEEGVIDGMTEQAEIAEAVLDEWKDKPVTADNNIEMITDLYQALETIVNGSITPASHWESTDV